MPRNDDSTDPTELSMGVHPTVIANHENMSPDETSDREPTRNSPVIAKHRDAREADPAPADRTPQPDRPLGMRGPLVISKLPRRQTRGPNLERLRAATGHRHSRGTLIDTIPKLFAAAFRHQRNEPEEHWSRYSHWNASRCADSNNNLHTQTSSLEYFQATREMQNCSNKIEVKQAREMANIHSHKRPWMATTNSSAEIPGIASSVSLRKRTAVHAALQCTLETK